MHCCVFYCHLTSQLVLKPFKQVVSFWFPSLRKVLDGYPLEAKTKITESMPAAPIPPQLIPCQIHLHSPCYKVLNQRKLAIWAKSYQDHSWTHSKPGQQIDPDQGKGVCSSKKPCTLLHGPLGRFLLSGPFMDTFEARRTNWPWPGKGSAQFKKAICMYFALWSPREIFVQLSSVSMAGPGSLIPRPGSLASFLQFRAL